MKKQWCVTIVILLIAGGLYGVDRLSTFGIYNYLSGYRELSSYPAAQEFGAALTAVELNFAQDSIISVRAATDGEKDTVWIRAQLVSGGADAAISQLDAPGEWRQWKTVLKGRPEIGQAPIRWWDAKDGTLFDLYRAERTAPVYPPPFHYSVSVAVDRGRNVLYIWMHR